MHLAYNLKVVLTVELGFGQAEVDKTLLKNDFLDHVQMQLASVCINMQ